MYYIGLDAGSTYLKAALIDEKGVISTHVLSSGVQNSKNADRIVKELCEDNLIPQKDIKKIFATGYSRRALDIADDTVSEITAHAFGIRYTCPNDKPISIVIDIGGQDMKVIALTDNRKVKNFIMNDKCAAGTGKFIEVVAEILDTTIDNVGPLSIKSNNPAEINSTCVVFAQTEIISLIARKRSREDILYGLHMSMAKRIGKMARKYIDNRSVVMTGGGSRNIGLVQALEDELMRDVYVANHSQFNGAIGAALYGMELTRDE